MIALESSERAPWPGLVAGSRGGAGVSIPNQVPGVYEVRDSGADDSGRLYIGKAGDLRSRVRQGLVKGKIPHPGGASIRAQEDVARLMVRWAVTGRPAAAEEELHQAYRRKFGRLPACVKNT